RGSAPRDRGPEAGEHLLEWHLAPPFDARLGSAGGRRSRGATALRLWLRATSLVEAGLVGRTPAREASLSVVAGGESLTPWRSRQGARTRRSCRLRPPGRGKPGEPRGSPWRWSAATPRDSGLRLG